jgi:hypothetical protein
LRPGSQALAGGPESAEPSATEPPSDVDVAVAVGVVVVVVAVGVVVVVVAVGVVAVGVVVVAVVAASTPGCATEPSPSDVSLVPSSMLVPVAHDAVQPPATPSERKSTGRTRLGERARIAGNLADLPTPRSRRGT